MAHAARVLARGPRPGDQHDIFLIALLDEQSYASRRRWTCSFQQAVCRCRAGSSSRCRRCQQTCWPGTELPLTATCIDGSGEINMLIIYRGENACATQLSVGDRSGQRCPRTCCEAGKGGKRHQRRKGAAGQHCQRPRRLQRRQSGVLAVRSWKT